MIRLEDAAWLVMWLIVILILGIVFLAGLQGGEPVKVKPQQKRSIVRNR